MRTLKSILVLGLALSTFTADVYKRQQQSPLPKNTETPKATWVQANHSVVPLYGNQREINGSHINNGEFLFPQESDSPHKPKLATELLDVYNRQAIASSFLAA